MAHTAVAYEYSRHTERIVMRMPAAAMCPSTAPLTNLLLAALLSASSVAAANVQRTEWHIVWPPPQHIAAHGPPLALHPGFEVMAPSPSPRLATAIARHAAIVSPALHNAVGGDSGLRLLRLAVATSFDELGMETDYSYNLTVSPTGASAQCVSIYGCIYALESFAQLLDYQNGEVLHSEISIIDKPSYQWRGVMLDAGRRFFPMDSLKDIMEVMVANKLNVLHLHASDYCRFGVESKLFPNLTAALTGVKGGFYSQADVKEMIAYAANLGIRVVRSHCNPIVRSQILCPR
eukprot:SAG31_NODE_3609_length_4070_cov_2.814153_2_plen_291_part_00